MLNYTFDMLPVRNMLYKLVNNAPPDENNENFYELVINCPNHKTAIISIRNYNKIKENFENISDEICYPLNNVYGLRELINCVNRFLPHESIKISQGVITSPHQLHKTYYVENLKVSKEVYENSHNLLLFANKNYDFNNNYYYSISTLTVIEAIQFFDEKYNTGFKIYEV